MELNQLKKRIADAQQMFNNISPEATVPYLLAALEEVVNVFGQLEKEQTKEAPPVPTQQPKKFEDLPGLPKKPRGQSNRQT